MCFLFISVRLKPPSLCLLNEFKQRILRDFVTLEPASRFTNSGSAMHRVRGQADFLRGTEVLKLKPAHRCRCPSPQLLPLQSFPPVDERDTLCHRSSCPLTFSSNEREGQVHRHSGRGPECARQSRGCLPEEVSIAEVTVGK